MRLQLWLSKPVVRGALGSLAGVVFVLLVLRLLGRPISWTAVQLGALPLAMAVVGAVVFLAARAWRFHQLLPDRHGGMAGVAGVTGVGWAASLLLPGPTGDVAFIAVARRVLGVSIARASGAAVLARVLDLASIALVAGLAAGVSAGDAPRDLLVLSTLAAGAGLALLVVLLLRRPRRAVLRQASRMPRLAALTHRADAAMAELTSGRVVASLAATTVVCRLATAVQYAGLMSMVGLHLGFWQTWFALSIRTLLFTVPVQGIAGIGTSQAWWTSALLLEGVPLGGAVAASVTLQALDLAVALPIAALSSLLVFANRLPARRRTLAAASLERGMPEPRVAVPAFAPAAIVQPQPADGD